jgi:hypothetical protein
LKLNEYISHIRRKYPRIGQSTLNDPEGVSNWSNVLLELNTLLDDANWKTTRYHAVANELNNEFNNGVQGVRAYTNVLSLLDDATLDGIKHLTQYEERNSGLNKTFKMNSAAAAKYADTLKSIAKDIQFGEATVQNLAAGLDDLTGGYISSGRMNKVFQKNLIQTQAILQEQLGVSEEAAKGFEQYAQSIGMTGAALLGIYEKDNVLDNLVSKTGMGKAKVLNTIIEEIGKTASDFRYTSSKIPGNLEIAVLKAKALGVSMEQLTKTGKNLLNIESSVGDELNYQMLTGQRLLDQDGNSITNQYRLAELQGNRSKQVSLMLQAVKSQKELLKNPINLDQFGQMFNIATTEVTDMIGKIETAEKMGTSAILDMTDDTKIAEELANARKKYIEQGKGTAADFDEYAKNFLSTKDAAADTRTEYEKKSEDYLARIAGNMDALATKAGVGGYSKQYEEQKKRVESFEKYREKVREPYTADKLTKDKILGVGNQLNRDQAEKIAQKDNNAVLKVAGKQTTQNDVNAPKYIGETPDEKSLIAAPVKTTKTGDALIIPDRGPILQPAKNDVIAAFRPNDVIANTLNQTAMPSATTAPAIDINALANAIASAVSKIKVEATIKQDTFLGTTNMNNPRLFT